MRCSMGCNMLHLFLEKLQFFRYAEYSIYIYIFSGFFKIKFTYNEIQHFKVQSSVIFQ